MQIYICVCFVDDESLPSKKYDIVISYELQSGKKCKDKLVQKLRDAGFFLWVDSDEEYGEFPERMADRIAGARVIMLLLSTHYAGSKTCDKQFQQALQTNKKIIPVKVEKFDPAEDSSLGKLMSDEVSYKLYKKFDANVKKIINALNQYLDKTGKTLFIFFISTFPLVSNFFIDLLGFLDTALKYMLSILLW